jgi:uncharacterized protein
MADGRGNALPHRVTAQSRRIVALCAAGAALAVALGAALGGASLPAHSQSFDCTKAASPIETAICAAPALRDADTALARTYAQAIAATAGDAAKAADLRAAQRGWIVQRNAACGAGAPEAIAACLTSAYREHMAALVAVTAAATPAQPVASQPAAALSTPANLPSEPPAGAAALARNIVPAAGDSDVLLTVDTAGRFAIRAQSRTGVALQLVDMIAGPGEIAGDAGTRDGRLDLLLDKGVYKLRVSGAKNANGDATLSVLPFRLAQAASASLLRGGHADTTLGDLDQRSWWVLVGTDKTLSVDATGRALRDLRAWRDGTDLVDMTPAAASVEPKAGHAMTRLRLDGAVEPGLYLVSAYGGDPLPWNDGDKAQPFHIVAGPPPFLAGGIYEGTIGPSGTARFELPRSATLARLELPDVAPARLSLRRGGAALASAGIAKTNREPVATATFSSGDGTIADVTGREGQAFRLRAMQPSSSLRAEGVGPYVIGVDLAGEGGNEFPATAVLAKFDKTGLSKGTQIVASAAPRIAPGQAWRRVLNLRGPSSLTFEIAGAGPVAARVQGVGARVTLEPLLGANAPRADGKIPRQWDVEAGWYMLRIDPVANAVGTIDLTFGQPGLVVDPTPPQPPRTTIDFGIQTLDRTSVLQVLVNNAPALVTGPRARALPADLAQGALMLEQAAKPATPTIAPAPTLPAPAPAPSPATSPTPPPRPQPQRTGAAAAPLVHAAGMVAPDAPKPKPVVPKPLPPKPTPVLATPQLSGDRPISLPVKAPLGGKITITDSAGANVAFTASGETIDKKTRTLTLTIPVTNNARTLVVAWTKDAANEPIPAIAAEGDRPRLVANTPFYFDLADRASRSFALDVPEGGLFRVETLGRLKTSAKIGTRFLPHLDDGADNGAGHNALVQTYLRAGRYRLDVSAQDSTGHLGGVARPTGLIDAGTLVAAGSARTSMTEGRGAVFGIDIAESGDYRLDLYGLNFNFAARLEDAEGWPLTVPGQLQVLQRRFEKGRYRLVVLPAAVDAQVVARLRHNEDAKPLEGHGPHPLPFDATTSFQWREPATRDAARTPDRWEFTLDGPAHVTLATSDGMTGDLVALADATKTIARVGVGRDFAGDLAAGRYALDMRALGRDDRLDYTLDLHADEIQPGRPRLLDLPATIPFAIADGRVVNLTTSGESQMSAVLKNDKGDVIERLSGRTDDWNIALSRRLPAGRYTLDLATLETPASASGASDSNDNPDDPPSAKAAATDDAKAGDSKSDDAKADDGDNAGEPDKAASNPADEHKKVELHFDLPAAQAVRDLPMSGTATAAGAQVQRFALPDVDTGSLLVVAAQSAAEIVLSLETTDTNGGSSVLGMARGRNPVVAIPVGSAGKKQVSVWSVDGGTGTIIVAARAISAAAQQAGPLSFVPLAIEGLSNTVGIAHVASPSKGLLSLAAPGAGLLVGSKPGRVLASFETGVVAPQSDSVWIIRQGNNAAPLAIANAADDRDLALALDAGDVALLGASASGDRLRVWRAEASDGQPGVASDRGGGLADGSAFAIAGKATRVWNTGDGPLRLRTTGTDVAQRPALSLDGKLALALAPASAQPVKLVSGAKRISLDLAAGSAALLSGGAGAPQTIWAGAKAISREFAGDWTDALFVNPGAFAVAAAIDAVPAEAAKPLAAGQAFKRFFGAAGSITIPVAGKSGDGLRLSGGAATYASANGRVTRADSISLDGAGDLTIDHPAGLVVAWIENGDATPWATGKPVAATLPSSTALGGASASFALHADKPLLLHARTTAPVIAILHRGDAQDVKDDLMPLPLGADVRLYLAAGDTELRLFPTQDGTLTGTLDLSTVPVTAIADGIGEAQILPPGGAAAFAFEVTCAGLVGAGVRSEPDRARVRLTDASGKSLGEGVALMRKLTPGRYIIEAQAPADGPTLTVRPAIVGLKPPPGGPPPDVAAKYLELVGMTAKR